MGKAKVALHSVDPQKNPGGYRGSYQIQSVERYSKTKCALATAFLEANRLADAIAKVVKLGAFHDAGPLHIDLSHAG